MMKSRALCLVIAAFAGWVPMSAAGQSRATVLRSIQAIDEAGMTVVTLAADGPLPMPVSDAIDGPARIFLDFAGVTTAATRLTLGPGGSVVRQARVALHSVSPNVTRVVLDLTRRESYRIDTDERHAGRVRILVGPGVEEPPAVGRQPPAPFASSTPAAAAAPPLSADPPSPAPAASAAATPPPAVTAPPAPVATAPPAPAPAASAAARNPTSTPSIVARPGLPAREAKIYRQELAGVLERMEAQRPLIARIDADENVDVEAVAVTMKELMGILHALESIKPSSVLRPTHDLLIASCTLALTASTLQLEASRENRPASRQNAASAAAGALMLLNLACADIGCASSLR
jgi:hypothetical protein